MKPIHTFTAVATLAITPAMSIDKIPPPDQQEAYQQKLFDLMDADDDGILTEKEFAVFVLWDEFRRYDLNSDGKITREEYDKISSDADYFAKLDATGKGHITFQDCLGSDDVAKHLHSEWKDTLKVLGLKDSKVIKRTDLPDLTPNN